MFLMFSLPLTHLPQATTGFNWIALRGSTGWQPHPHVIPAFFNEAIPEIYGSSGNVLWECARQELNPFPTDWISCPKGILHVSGGRFGCSLKSRDKTRWHLCRPRRDSDDVLTGGGALAKGSRDGWNPREGVLGTKLWLRDKVAQDPRTGRFINRGSDCG